MNAMNYDVSRLLEAIDRFGQVKLLVVGDVMLDEFIWGTVDRISPEAPVPVVDVRQETRLLGGAANVINNIVSAGGQAVLVGVVGNDNKGRDVRRMIEGMGGESRGILLDDDRPTTIKTRIVAHGQQMVRFDRERRAPISSGMVADMLSFLDTAVCDAQGVILSDYGKGVISAPLIGEVRRICGENGCLLAVDPKVQNFGLYRNVSIITPNHHEAAQGAGVVIDSEETLQKAGWKIIEDLDCESVLITRGEKGMTLFERDRPPVNIPTVARQVFDVTGAGDTVIAILTLAMAAGLSRYESAVLANFAAGVVVGEVGTSTITADKLKDIVSAGEDCRRKMQP